MITEVKTLAEINQQAINLLYQELGVINAVRFLKQFTVGFGDYTKAVSYTHLTLPTIYSV